MAKINYEQLFTVFAVLYRAAAPLTTKEVQAQAGVTPNRALKQLNGFGFVNRTRQGRRAAWELTAIGRHTGRTALTQLQQKEETDK